MSKKYDFIIIGSGMGGLTSAVILAKEGYKVCVLEKNNQYGGNLQTFSRDKTIFDTGVHYIGGLDKGDNLSNFFKYLEINHQIELERMDIDGYDYITFDNDPIQYPHAQGYQNFVEQLSKYFPDERDVIEEYIRKISGICDSFPMYNLKGGDVYDEEILNLNLKEFLDQLTDNEKLKAVLVGTNLLYGGNGDIAPLYVHALSVSSYIRSSWRCIRGGSQISKAMIKVLRKYKGDIFKRSEVKELLFEEDRLIGVKVNNVQEFYADNFISNIDLNAFIDISGERAFRKSFRNRIKNLEVTISSFTLHIAFKPETFPYLNYNIYHINEIEDVWKIPSKVKGDWPKAYMVSMGIDEKNQKFAKSMSIMTYLDFDLMKKWEHTENTIVNPNHRGDDYEKYKEELIEKTIAALEKKFPDLRDCISSVHTSTPLSYRDYIGGKKGNMYGFIKESDNPLKTFISPRTKLPNLFLTGQTVNMHGIMGVTIGAFNTCSRILGRDYLMNKVNHEIKNN